MSKPPLSPCACIHNDVITGQSDDDVKPVKRQTVRFHDVIEESADVTASETEITTSSHYSSIDKTSSARSNRETVDRKVRRVREDVSMLFNSGREERRGIKAILGIISGVLIGGLLFVLLRFSFNYNWLASGVITAVSTVLISLGLAISPLCRCIMAVLLPTFFTGKGRAILLSVIYGVLLTGPIANIVHNSRETGRGMACTVELIKEQARALQGSLSDSVKDMAEYVDKQGKELRNIVGGTKDAMDSAKTSLLEIDKALDHAHVLDVVYQVYTYGGITTFFLNYCVSNFVPNFLLRVCIFVLFIQKL